MRTRLLGRHNVANLLAAAAVGTSLDLPLDAIGRALARVSPPAHRLAPILNRQAGIVVIDDAYNSNPVGAAAALEVLASHQAERRLLVTPGMVELGEREAEENERFGERAAAVCDLVVLVGEERSKPILAGLNAASFPDSQIHVVANSLGGRGAAREDHAPRRRGAVRERPPGPLCGGRAPPPERGSGGGGHGSK